MSQSKSNKDKTPWHIWVVGIVSLLWNAIGAMDFVMTQTKNAEYMGQFTPAQLEFFYGFPLWVIIAWAVAVWGGVLGSVFLLLRKTLAVWSFFASFIAMLITTIHNFVFSNALEVIGDTFSLIFSAVIFVIGFALYWYARKIQTKNMLN